MDNTHTHSDTHTHTHTHTHTERPKYLTTKQVQSKTEEAAHTHTHSDSDNIITQRLAHTNTQNKQLAVCLWTKNLCYAFEFFVILSVRLLYVRLVIYADKRPTK